MENFPIFRKRASRAKPNLVWQNIEKTSAEYSNNYIEIARIYPLLSPQELRVAALIKAELLSCEICEMLRIEEHSVENYRYEIRKKIKLPHEVNLQTYLAGL